MVGLGAHLGTQSLGVKATGLVCDGKMGPTDNWGQIVEEPDFQEFMTYHGMYLEKN